MGHNPDTTRSYAPTSRLMGMKLSLLSFQDGLTKVLDMATNTPKGQPAGYACFANVHMTITARSHLPLRSATDQATFVFTDGKPLCAALRLTQGISQERIAGMDFMPQSLALAADQGLKVYLLGGSPNTNNKVRKVAQQTYPNLQIVGAESPPFRPLTPAEDNAIIDRINTSGADLLYVALGCPKQEVWMMERQDRIWPFMLGVGGAFPVFAGLEARAPQWAQRLSLEWLYRLLQDPKRLWKRYLLTNTHFMLLLGWLLIGHFLAYCIPNGRKSPPQA
jgi:N-acetylglucosaminyldiphosphoundecaprenol N-acetyl-beta-D-mannosaminyltransferase